MNKLHTAANVQTMNNTQRLAKIDDLLKGLPQFKCVEGCNACCGVTGATRLEWARIVKVSGRSEKEIHGEAAKNVSAFEATDNANHLRCPLLKPGGGCSVHEVKPATCKLFGVVDTELLRCPHGGIAKRLISETEADRIMDEVERLGY